jgi:hypothetical protein
VLKEIILASSEKAFQMENGKQFDIVFNLAAETKYGQAEEVRLIYLLTYR